MTNWSSSASSNRTKARLDDVVAQALDEGQRLVRLEGLLVRSQGLLELDQVAQPKEASELFIFENE